jgi:transposase
MWYTIEYANTLSCALAHGGRAGHPEDRSPVNVRLYRTPLPDAPRQCCGAVNHSHCLPPALHRPDRAQRHSCLSPTWPRWVAAAIVATAHPGDPLRCWGLRVPPGPVAPESADVRQAHESVDTRSGRRGQFCPGTHAAIGQRRSDSSGPPPIGGGLEACQALDHQSRSGLSPKKQRRDRLIQRAMAQSTWALGFGDEVWWSRLAQPDQHSWTDTEVTHKLQALTAPTDDPDPKALACYGLLVRPGPQQADQMWLRFVAGRPVSAVTIDFLAWCSAQLAAQGFTALLLIWDNASWHRSQAVRRWIRRHNQPVKRGAVGVRLVICHLPSRSPWLNPIEPKWVHGKRAVSEADRLLRADELEARVYAYYGCQREAHLVMPKKVA